MEGSSGYEELHRLNPYLSNRPDALQLAQQHPELFGSYLREIGSTGASTVPLSLSRVDWTSGAFAAAVTRALLLHDFDIRCELPEDRLCPPVPNRLNYICWLRELLHDGPSEQLLPVAIPLPDSYSYSTGANAMGAGASNKVTVLDIGVGSSCIYPLLGRRLYGWTFVCSDIDEVNVRNAVANASNNAHFVGDSGVAVKLVQSSEELQRLLVQRVVLPLQAGGEAASLSEVVVSSPQCRGPVRLALLALDGFRDAVVVCEEVPTLPTLPLCVNEATLLDAVMTNPPFYSSEAEVGHNSRTVCTGAKGELVTEGGELAFVLAMVVDSLLLHRACRWYSCMIGIKANLSVLRRVLRSKMLLGTGTLPRVRECRFTQGVTMRWGLAWSWLEGPEGGGAASTAAGDASYSFGVCNDVMMQTATAEEVAASGGVGLDTTLLHGRIVSSLLDPAVARSEGGCLCGPFVRTEGEGGDYSSTCRLGVGGVWFTIRTSQSLVDGRAGWEVRVAGPAIAALGERLRNDIVRDTRRWRRKRGRDAPET